MSAQHLHQQQQNDKERQQSECTSSDDDSEARERREAERCRAEERPAATHHMCHVPLRDAADTLRAGAGDSASEAETLEAIAVVRQFAESKKRVTRDLAVTSGVIPYLVALVFDTKGIKSGSDTVQEAALHVLKLLVQREGDDACRVVASTIDPCAIPALLQGSGDGRSVALKILEVAKWYFPHQRNAMLAAGAGPALVELASLADESGDAKEARSVINRAIHRFRLCQTVAQLRAALPGLLECARRPEAAVYALRLISMLVHGSTEVHVQAALDAGTADVVMGALRSDADDVVGEACEVLSELVSGSAEQLATLLDAGVVAALCATIGFPLYDGFCRGMVMMSVLGDDDMPETKESTHARRAILRDRLVPELLAILTSATTEYRPFEYGAALWIKVIASYDSHTTRALRERGVIPTLIEFLSVKSKTTDMSVIPAALALDTMPAETPLESVAVARAALPALARLCASESPDVRSTVMRSAGELIEWRASCPNKLLHPDEHTEARVQAAIDNGFVPLILMSLHSFHSHVANCTIFCASTCVAAGSAQHMRCFLEAGFLGALLRGGSSDHCFSMSSYTDAARNLVEAAVTLQSAAANGWDATIVDSVVRPQVLESLDSEEHYIHALHMLWQMSEKSEQCREVVFGDPRILSVLARHVEELPLTFRQRTTAKDVLCKLCQGPPAPSAALAYHLVSTLLPLSKSEGNSFAASALECLHALAKVIPEAVDETLRENDLPLPPRRRTK